MSERKEVNLITQPTHVFEYRLDDKGEQVLHCRVGMLQGKHIEYIDNHYQLKDDAGNLMRNKDTGSVLVDWNAAAKHFYHDLFKGCEETVRLGGEEINTRTNEGKDKLNREMDSGFAGWVMNCARNRKIFYARQQEADASLPPAPGGEAE